MTSFLNPLLRGNLFAIGRHTERPSAILECARRYRLARHEEQKAEVELSRAAKVRMDAQHDLDLAQADLDQAQVRFAEAQREADEASEAVLHASEAEG